MNCALLRRMVDSRARVVFLSFCISVPGLESNACVVFLYQGSRAMRKRVIFLTAISLPTRLRARIIIKTCPSLPFTVITNIKLSVSRSAATPINDGTYDMPSSVDGGYLNVAGSNTLTLHTNQGFAGWTRKACCQLGDG